MHFEVREVVRQLNKRMTNKQDGNDLAYYFEYREIDMFESVWFNDYCLYDDQNCYLKENQTLEDFIMREFNEYVEKLFDLKFKKSELQRQCETCSDYLQKDRKIKYIVDKPCDSCKKEFKNE